jgi:hypothetical protein
MMTGSRGLLYVRECQIDSIAQSFAALAGADRGKTIKP